MKAPALLATCCAVGVPALAASGPPKIALTKPLPSLGRIGQRVTISGRVLGAPAKARAALQTGGPRRWATLATAPLRARASFTIHWHVAGAERVLTLRVIALSGGRVIARTAARRSIVGPEAHYCSPPAPPAVDIPVGDGWIAGGLYLEGGPAPGIFECVQQPYTINVETSSGAIVASQAVAGGHSYTIVVPAGSYNLRSTGCGFGSATVTAGRGTTANTVCPVP